MDFNQFLQAAQAPQKTNKKPTRQARADRALENQYKEKEERVYGDSTPRNAVTGKYWGERTTALLEDEGYADPRWMTESQALKCGGKDQHGTPRVLVGIKKDQRNKGVDILTRMSTEKKNGETTSFGVAFTLYHISQCYGVTESDNGILPDKP